MKTILVDDEILSLEYFAQECEDIEEIEIVGKFDYPKDALEYAKSNRVDLVISDINMPEMTGLELAKALNELNPDILIVFVTGYGEYAQEAMALRAATYLMKPYSKDDIIFAVDRAKRLYRGNKSGISVKTFGRFNVFFNGQTLHFKNAKAKELFALCIEHNGGVVTMEEAIEYLWPDKPFDNNVKSLYRRATKDLSDMLKEIGCEDIFEKPRGSIFVDVSKLDCDFCDLVHGDFSNFGDYMGEFMYEYSWAENTNAMIKRKLRQHQERKTI